MNILVTNDDGIDSPGLWALAEAMSRVGETLVVAPAEQQSGVGNFIGCDSFLTGVARYACVRILSGKVYSSE